MKSGVLDPVLFYLLESAPGWGLCSAGLPGHIQRSCDRESVIIAQRQQLQSIDQHQVPVIIADNIKQ